MSARHARAFKSYAPASKLAQLYHAAALLASRAEALEARLADDETAWRPYCETILALATVEARLVPGEHGELLTTAQMADRLGLKPKTLLRHAAAGAVKPALRRGKLIRWKGDEGLR